MAIFVINLFHTVQEIFDICFLSHFVITASYFVISIFYFIYQFQKGDCLSTKYWGKYKIVPDLPMARLLITWSADKLKTSYYSTTVTKATISKRGCNTFLNETLSFLHVMWYNHVVTWRTSRNVYQNRRVPLLHFMRPIILNQSNQSYSPSTCVDESYQFLQDAWFLIMLPW